MVAILLLITAHDIIHLFYQRLLTMTHKHICTQCGKEFDRETITKGNAFCSRACYDVFRTPAPILCKTCNQPLTGAQRAARRGFCSRACYDASREKVQKMCPTCGKAFYVPASMVDRYTVCSRACRLADTEYATCEVCGKRFTVAKGRSRHHCSEECRRPPVYADCKTCGTTFRMIPGDTDRQFCSMACYRRHRGENRLEKRVRVSLDAMGIEYVQEAKMGRYSIDFALPHDRIALEVDGAYWHRDAKKDARKERYLSDYGWRVVRLPERDIETAADLPALITSRLAHA